MRVHGMCKSLRISQALQGLPQKVYPRGVQQSLDCDGHVLFNQFINSCALCGLCGEVCPTDVDMGAICKDARPQMVEQKRMPPSAHDFALRDMAFSNGDKFSLARNAPGMLPVPMSFSRAAS